jgi:hypothetical protein
MSTNKKLAENLLKADSIDPNTTTDTERLAFKKMLDKQSKPAQQPGLWRIIMKSKMTKFATAAIITIAVVIGIKQFGGSIDGTTRVYAMSDVPELFYSARNIYMKMKLYFPEAGDEVDPITVEVEHWLDIEKERWRSIKPSTQSGPEGFKLNLSEEIADGSDFELNIDYDKKEASFSKISPLTRKIRCRSFSELIMTLICGDPRFYDLYENIGSEVIDGHSYNLWELKVIHERLPDAKIQVWLSPATGDFAKGIMWFGGDDEGWKKKVEFITVEQNISMPDELFAMEAPEGYQFTNTRQNANNESLFGGVSTAWNSYTLVMHRMFSLPDGSVIRCWSSWDKDSQQSQAQQFAELEIGGDFPKLPYEVYALDTNLNRQKIVLPGRHLCFTEHEGMFYEWGVYVPRERITSQELRVLTYTLVYRTHVEANISARLGPSADLHVRDADDFDTFVLGTMAAFSDDDMAPEGITYDVVLDLIEDIRQDIE